MDLDAIILNMGHMLRSLDEWDIRAYYMALKQLYEKQIALDAAREELKKNSKKL